MTGDEQLIDDLGAAVAAAPDALALRLHLARLLLGAGRAAEACAELSAVLERDPNQAEARALLAEIGSAASSRTDRRPAGGFDWEKAEKELGDVIPDRFVGPEPADDSVRAHDAEPQRLRLADVAGMAGTKERIEAAFLAPLRNPELRAFFGKQLRGGLLLYGPPGCGKTFLARAVAGEMGAAFVTVSILDVLSGEFLGDVNRNLHEAFDVARRSQPCVLFLDELDALGQRRGRVGGGLRVLVNQLLEELDGLGADNEGVFVLAATNHPWEVDTALTRPGRLDRSVFVPPPDAGARSAILRFHLDQRPIANIDASRLAEMTSGYSGADLAHVCETAASAVLLEVVRSGQRRLINMDDMIAAVRDTRPSIGSWVDTAKNVVTFANADGRYDELAAWLHKRREK